MVSLGGDKPSLAGLKKGNRMCTNRRRFNHHSTLYAVDYNIKANVKFPMFYSYDVNRNISIFQLLVNIDCTVRTSQGFLVYCYSKNWRQMHESTLSMRLIGTVNFTSNVMTTFNLSQLLIEVTLQHVRRGV